MIFPIDRISEQYRNKYEAIIVAAKEARRINALRMAAGGAPEGAVEATMEGLRRATAGDVSWRYTDRSSRGMNPEKE